MSGVDPLIVEHKMKTYLDAKLVRQRLRAVNPRKAPAIKAERETTQSWFYLSHSLDGVGFKPCSGG